MSRVAADGSAAADRASTVEIDRSNPAHKWRFVCPNGHTDWDRTNNHIWCRSCRRQAEHGAEMDPEHYRLYDKRTDELISWRDTEMHPRVVMQVDG